MAYCSACGHQNAVNARFCISCGQPLPSPIPAPPAPQRISRLAMVSVTLGVAAIVFAFVPQIGPVITVVCLVVGLPLSAILLIRNRGQGRLNRTAGIACNGVAVVVMIVAIAVSGDDSNSGSPAPLANTSPPSRPAVQQPTSAPAPTLTPVPLPTDTPFPTATPVPSPVPTETPIPMPVPTATPFPAPTPTPGPDRRALLEAKVLEWGNAFANHDWEGVHATYSDEFKVKCPLNEFVTLLPILNTYSGRTVPKGAEFVLERIKIFKNAGWEYSYFELNGEQFIWDEDQYEADEPYEATWLTESDSWEFTVTTGFESEERPCSLDRYRGRVIELPFHAGSTIEGVDGTEITVTRVVSDAWPLVQKEHPWNDPPEEGNKYYMIGLEVSYVSGAGALGVGQSDFKLVGSNRVVYGGLIEDCDIIPDGLSATLYEGGRIQGNICFQVAQEDSEFILIHQPVYSSEATRYLSLEATVQ